jgi:hypothetical protein
MPAPDEQVLYAASMLHCLLVDRTEPAATPTGTFLRTATLERVAAEAGFTSVEVLPIERGASRFYRSLPRVASGPCAATLMVCVNPHPGSRASLCAMSSNADTDPDRRETTGPGSGIGVRRSMEALASLVRIVTVLFAAVLVLHVVLTVASANPNNGVAMVLAAAADRLTLGLGDLFAPSSPSLGIILNYGLPAVVWLIVGIIVSRLISALAR